MYILFLKSLYYTSEHNFLHQNIELVHENINTSCTTDSGHYNNDYISL